MYDDTLYLGTLIEQTIFNDGEPHKAHKLGMTCIAIQTKVFTFKNLCPACQSPISKCRPSRRSSGMNLLASSKKAFTPRPTEN